MISDFLRGQNWDEAPQLMNFSLPFGDVFDEVEALASRLSGVEPRRATDSQIDAALSLFVMAPAIVNVPLNYKICAEHGLPLHPSVYYELTQARRYRLCHPLEDIEAANRLYRDSIPLALAAYRLDPHCARLFAEFRERLPTQLSCFMYTGGADNYTWRASEPDKIMLLAEKIAARYAPALLVGAAHGAIMPGLLLSAALDLPIYFIRFSMFKRSDEKPIVSLADEVWLSAWKDSPALLFDEDVAKGGTLEGFAQRLAPLFAQSMTASVIRHAGSSIKPDFCAKIWWD